MKPEQGFMRQIGDDFAIVPGMVIALELHEQADSNYRAGVTIHLTSGSSFFRPAQENSAESARELFETWVTFANGGGTD